MGVDFAFLRRENRLQELNIRCAECGAKIELFINDMASAGEVWPFCEKCGTYVDVVPSD